MTNVWGAMALVANMHNRTSWCHERPVKCVSFRKTMLAYSVKKLQLHHVLELCRYGLFVLVFSGLALGDMFECRYIQKTQA